MTTEPSAPLSGESDVARPGAAAGPDSGDGTALLRRHLRVRLDRHIRKKSFQPSLTVVGFRGDQVDVLRQGIDQPEDAVLELVLPHRYFAVGVLASSVVATPPKHRHQDAALAIAVPRSGPIVSLLATADAVVDTFEPQGWLIDACLRSVGRPTAPNQIPALEFPIALWLDRLMVALVNAPASQPVCWTTAVRLCPIPRQWRSEDPIDLGGTLGSTTRSWDGLRNETIGGRRAPAGVTADRARWMDDAMFARWCMGSFPDVASLRGDVEFLAPAEVAENIEIALRAAWLAFAG